MWVHSRVIHVFIYMWRLESDIRQLPYVDSHLTFLQTEFLTSTYWWPYTGWPVNSSDLSASSSQAFLTHMCTVTANFVCVCWGSKLSQVSHLHVWKRQGNSWLSYLSSLSPIFFKYHLDFIIFPEDRFFFSFLKYLAAYKGVIVVHRVAHMGLTQ